ncbi:L-threonylcarbamoyladenylate synthase [Methylococcus sp. EFPC2]|uniref:L-threonylcarbamoyladenylate synthase n=1 Tax=Methylococcus sp. EFPC2 TaxID=2812648 RepID=UPI001967CEC9|nr:L-threonylcarbamoyladenylate synthase [Methylococcus sp. EFPC2]QSA98360.1 threonylcarbamoyl-AMP synthase [Methylococcus sp. EFPC2]
MVQFVSIHPKTPQPRLIQRAADVVRGGGLIVYPTDTCYAFGCRLDSKDASDRIRRIRQLEESHNFTIICHDLSQAAAFAKIGNEAFRLIKSLTPGPYTFILKATRETPKRLQHPKRKTIGIRLPDHAITQALVAELGEPLFSSTLLLPGDEDALSDPYDIRERLDNEVDLIVDADVVPAEYSTVIGLTEDVPELIRQGKGEVHFLR